MKYKRIELDLQAHASQKYIVRARVIGPSGHAVDAIAKEKNLKAAQKQAIQNAKEAFEEEFGSGAMPEPAEPQTPQGQRVAFALAADSDEKAKALAEGLAKLPEKHGRTPEEVAAAQAFVDAIEVEVATDASDCDGQVDGVSFGEPAPAPDASVQPMTTLRERYPALAKMLSDLGAEELVLHADPQERHAAARTALLRVVQQGRWNGGSIELGDLKEICHRLHGTRKAKDLSAEVMEQLADQIAAGPTEEDLQVAAVQREYLSTNDFSREPFLVSEVMAVAETPWAVVLVSETIREFQRREYEEGAAA